MARFPLSRPLSASLLVAAFALLALPLLGGCDRDAPRERIDINTGRTGGGNGGSSAAEDGQCVQWLEGAVGSLRPGKLDRTADADKAAQLLTLFLGQEACTGVPPGPLPLAPEADEVDAANALLVRLLGEAGAKDVTARRVDAEDSRFFRTRMMDAAAVDAQISRDASPETVAVALNGAVARRLFPLSSTLLGDERPAGSTYHARLRGEGDWADRGWLLADLLRQAGIDSVLLTPWGTGDPSEPSAWLGALLPAESADEGEAGEPAFALFDLRTGLPVPSPNAPDRPVRLSELRSDEAARTALSEFYQVTGLPVPDAAALDDLTPQLIGEPGWWRMASGLISLPPVDGSGGSRTPRVFDPLHDRGGQPGLVSRVAAAGFDADAIALWPVPAERSAADAATPETFAAPLRIGLKTPGEVTVNDEGEFQYNRAGAQPTTGSSDQLWDARHAQLAGGRSGVREATGSLEEMLSPEQIGSLFSPRPLPPASDAEIRGERAAAIRNADETGTPEDAPNRELQNASAIVQAAIANQIAPWWTDNRPVPQEMQELHARAAVDATYFLAETQSERGRPRLAGEEWGRLVNGPPNARKAAAASRLVELVADAGNVEIAAQLARQFAGGPDAPRLNVWIARWTAPPPSEPEPAEAEESAPEPTDEQPADEQPADEQSTDEQPATDDLPADNEPATDEAE